MAMLLLAFSVSRVYGGYSTAIVATDPPSVEIPSVGETVTVNVTVAEVTGLVNWQVKIDFNISVVNCTGAWFPPDHVFKGAEDAGLTIVAPPPEIYHIDNKWYVMYGCTFVPYGEWSFNGTGVLCQINFTGLAVGNSSLQLGLPPPPGETCLLTWNGTDLVDILSESVDGEVIVVPEFPAFTLVALFMIATIVAVILGIKSWSKKHWKRFVTK